MPRTFLYAPSSLSETYTANGLNQYTAVGAARPMHDNNGNLKTIGSWTYTYDLENRLTRAVKTEGGVTTTSTYAYGPEDRRLSKTVGTVTTSYNFRLILNWLRLLLRTILEILIAAFIPQSIKDPAS